MNIMLYVVICNVQNKGEHLYLSQEAGKTKGIGEKKISSKDFILLEKRLIRAGLEPTTFCETTFLTCA